jgi:four helix bundle protein
MSEKRADPPAQVIRDYKDLQVWQKGMALAKQIYQMTQAFPSEEKFGIVSQMRRAAVSVPSNIAEGQARNTTGEFVQFLSHAEGSLAELDTQVRLSVTLGFCRQPDGESVSASITELQKMLKSLRGKLAARHSPLTTYHL